MFGFGALFNCFFFNLFCFLTVLPNKLYFTPPINTSTSTISHSKKMVLYSTKSGSWLVNHRGTTFGAI